MLQRYARNQYQVEASVGYLLTTPLRQCLKLPDFERIFWIHGGNWHAGYHVHRPSHMKGVIFSVDQQDTVSAGREIAAPLFAAYI